VQVPWVLQTLGTSCKILAGLLTSPGGCNTHAAQLLKLSIHMLLLLLSQRYFIDETCVLHDSNTLPCQ
jgi:hypothetical protein